MVFTAVVLFLLIKLCEVLLSFTIFGLTSWLIYVIMILKPNEESEKKARHKMNADHDIIGISIIVSGDSIGGNHAKSIRINIPKQSEED